MTRRPFTPPDPPPVAVPDVSPALHKGTGTRAIGDRLRFWRAFAGLGLALWQVPPGVCWLLDAPWAWAPLVVYEAAGLAGVLAVGIAWVLLTFRQDLAQYRAMLDLWNVEITAKERGYATQRRVARAHARRWFRLPRRRERVIKVRVAGESSAISHQPSADATTRQLPALPGPAPYYGTDAYQVMDAAFHNQPFGVNTLGRRLGKARHAAAVDRLLRAEVLTPPAGKGQGPALVPAFARFRGDPALGHAEVARVLGAPGPAPTEGRDSAKRDA